MEGRVERVAHGRIQARQPSHSLYLGENQQCFLKP